MLQCLGTKSQDYNVCTFEDIKEQWDSKSCRAPTVGFGRHSCYHNSDENHCFNSDLESDSAAPYSLQSLSLLRLDSFLPSLCFQHYWKRSCRLSLLLPLADFGYWYAFQFWQRRQPCPLDGRLKYDDKLIKFTQNKL